ncbi:T9SS type A sorting domain-containing protein, partial [Flavobacterium sp.]|uniref:T9SS type A sorting domain-containing protein n=1 Tax=Flavobacterium sp. TaxID=239 RepID=UPI00260A1BF8
ITTTAGASRQTSTALDIYEVKAYPNPYAETFKLDVNTSSEDQVGVKVYDMMGREVESRQSSVEGITNLEIGSRYPSGVYNIIVTQGDNVKTLRVIKR